MGLGLPKCGSCLPDAISLAKDADRQEDTLSGSNGQHAYHTAGQLVDEHLAVTPASDGDVIVFRDAHPSHSCTPAPAAAPAVAAPAVVAPAAAVPAAARRYEYGADSASMLNDFDFLASPEWQTLPPATTTALDEKLLAEAKEASTGTAAYQVALRGLWHNCPDALEVALQRLDMNDLTEMQARDAEFMMQKLEFTRIRQEFVVICHEFRGQHGSLYDFKRGVAEIEERCNKLMAAQPDEQCSQLPGLVQKRDTIMLLARIRAIYKQLQELKPQISD